jgi:hypothetical protein
MEELPALAPNVEPQNNDTNFNEGWADDENGADNLDYIGLYQ